MHDPMHQAGLCDRPLNVILSGWQNWWIFVRICTTTTTGVRVTRNIYMQVNWMCMQIWWNTVKLDLQIASSMYLAGYSRHLQPSSNVWLRARCTKCMVEQQKKSKLLWVAHVLPSECCDGAEVSCNFRCILSIWSHAQSWTCNHIKD